MKEHKNFDPIHFMALCCVACVAGFITVQGGSQDLGFLNREQTNEWKGWMQRTRCCSLG
jgi:N-acetylneuraminate 9-O-acetyltransferase